jgi:hypothetical protein
MIYIVFNIFVSKLISYWIMFICFIFSGVNCYSVSTCSLIYIYDLKVLWKKVYKTIVYSI